MVYNVYLNCGSWCISTDLHLVYLVVVVHIYTKYLYLYCGSWCISTNLHLVYKVVVVYIYTKYIYFKTVGGGVYLHGVSVSEVRCVAAPARAPPSTSWYSGVHSETRTHYTYLHISTHIYVSLHRRTSTHLHINIYVSLYLNSTWNTYISTPLTINWYSLFWISGIHISQTEQFRYFAMIHLILLMLF